MKKDYPLFVQFKEEEHFDLFIKELMVRLKAKPCYESYPPEIEAFSLETPRMWIGFCSEEKRIAFVPKRWNLERGEKHYILKAEMEIVQELLDKCYFPEDYVAELSEYDQGVVP